MAPRAAAYDPDTGVPIELVVNGVTRRGTVPPRTSLADFLRDHLGLTGTYLGCEHGVCGACTILLDGRSVRSCLVLAAQAFGRSVRTAEGLSDGDPLNPLQAAPAEHHGLQCGFCTPGFPMVATELLAEKRDLDEDEVRERLSGNLCRCTGYQGIVEAILALAREFTPPA